MKHHIVSTSTTMQSRCQKEMVNRNGERHRPPPHQQVRSMTRLQWPQAFAVLKKMVVRRKLMNFCMSKQGVHWGLIDMACRDLKSSRWKDQHHAPEFFWMNLRGPLGMRCFYTYDPRQGTRRVEKAIATFAVSWGESGSLTMRRMKSFERDRIIVRSSTAKASNEDLVR